MCTMMAGVMLVVLGLTGLGTAVRFIPRPVVVGFTNGIAVLIASTQIKDFFGLQVDERAGRVRGRASRRSRAHFRHVLAGDDAAGGRRAGVVIVVMTGSSSGCPAPSSRCVLGTRGRGGLLDLPVETIGTRFGGIPSGLPAVARAAVPPRD